jgi:hypothetical protein
MFNLNFKLQLKKKIFEIGENSNFSLVFFLIQAGVICLSKCKNRRNMAEILLKGCKFQNLSIKMQESIIAILETNENGCRCHSVKLFCRSTPWNASDFEDRRIVR